MREADGELEQVGGPQHHFYQRGLALSSGYNSVLGVQKWLWQELQFCLYLLSGGHTLWLFLEKKKQRKRLPLNQIMKFFFEVHYA